MDVAPDASDSDIRDLILTKKSKKNDACVLYNLLLDQRQSQIMLAEQEVYFVEVNYAYIDISILYFT